MLKIRLLRIGKKDQPSYKIVVTEKGNPPDGGRFVEQVGFFNPITKAKNFKKDRIEYWISKGAQLSDTLHNLLVAEKIIEGKKVKKHSLKKEKKETKEAETAKETKETESKEKEEKQAKKAEEGKEPEQTPSTEEKPSEAPEPETKKQETEPKPEEEKPSDAETMESKKDEPKEDKPAQEEKSKEGEKGIDK